MRILAHARLREDCPLSILNTMYPDGVQLWVIEGTEDTGFEPTLLFGDVAFHEAIVTEPLRQHILSDIIRNSRNVPNEVRCAWIHHGIVALPMHWIQSILSQRYLGGGEYAI